MSELTTALYGDAVWQSEPERIGKHEWRVTVWEPYAGAHRFVGYEWRRADGRGFVDHRGRWHGPEGSRGTGWYADEEWPRYDRNNGQTAGMPATLRKLYERHYPTFSKHLRQAKETPNA